jgi:hypothetical protein
MQTRSYGGDELDVFELDIGSMVVGFSIEVKKYMYSKSPNYEDVDFFTDGRYTRKAI